MAAGGGAGGRTSLSPAACLRGDEDGGAGGPCAAAAVAVRRVWDGTRRDGTAQAGCAPRLRAERARLPPPVTRRCPRTGAMEDEERLKKLEAGKAKVGGGCGGAGTGTRGGDGDGGCGGGPGSARLGSAGTRGEQSLGGGVRFVLPRAPSLLPSLLLSVPAGGRGRPRRGERHRWRRSPAPRRLAPEPFKPRRLPESLPGGLQSRQLRLSVLLMPLRRGDYGLPGLR